MSSSSNIGDNGRKRTRLSFLAEDSTPSDPALFSSDPPDPSAEHYFAPRRKKQYKGTWWQNGQENRRERKAFERNLDSGVFMGSDSSLESLDAEVAEDLKSDDTAPDEARYLDGGYRREDVTMPRRRVQISEPASVIQARKRIAYFAEDGSWEDSTILDPDIREWVLEQHAGFNLNCEVLSLDNLDLPYLTDDMLAPLRSMVRPHRWNPRIKHASRGQLIDSESDGDESQSDEGRYSLNSDEDLVELDRPYVISVHHTALSDLPPGLFDLPGLIGLFIGSNNLERIPVNICNLRRLGVLNVHGNRLRWLPGEIVDVIRTAEHEKFRLFVSANPLLQPFSYVGLRDLFDEPKDGFRMPLVPYTVKELAQRMDRLKALAASEGSTQGTRTLQEEQRRWILRLYQHYRAIPEMVWLQGRYIYSHSKEEEEEILGKWSVTQGSGDSVRAVENAFGNMALQSRHALRHQTFLMGATPVCYLDISGRPIEAGTILPSELPMDQIILPARLLAVPKPPVLNNIPGRKIESLDVLRPCTTPPRQTKTHVHSLFSLSLASASTVSELHHLPSLLPDDAPESVQRGLDMAIEARNEGGRTCYACKRSFIVPRAEWVEYHFLANSFEDCRIVEDGFDELFVPFLRTVCSWGCVPHFEFDDE